MGIKRTSSSTSGSSHSDSILSSQTPYKQPLSKQARTARAGEAITRIPKSTTNLRGRVRQGAPHQEAPIKRVRSPEESDSGSMGTPSAMVGQAKRQRLNTDFMADIDRMIEGKQPPDAFFDCLSTLIPADQVSAAVYIAIKAGAESQATLLWNCVKWVGNGFQKELAIETAHRLPLDLGHKAIERIIQDPETPDANKSAFFITLNQALCQPGIPGRHQSDETVVMNLQLQCLKEVVVSPEIAQGWVNTIAQAYQQSVVTHNSPQDPIPFVRKYNLFRQAAQLLPKPFKEQAVIALQRASNILVDAARTVFRTDSHVFTYWRTQKIETASPLFEMWISNLWEAGLNASAKELAKKAILSDEARIRCFEVCGLGYPF